MIEVLNMMNSKEFILNETLCSNDFYPITFEDSSSEIIYRPMSGRITITCKSEPDDVSKYTRISYSWVSDIFSVQYGDRLDNNRELYIFGEFSTLLKPEGYFMVSTTRELHFTHEEFREAISLILDMVDKCKART